MSHLLRPLRAAARQDAALALLPRLADPVTREWAAERIAKGEINRLSIWVGPGRPEETGLAAWHGERTPRWPRRKRTARRRPPDKDRLLDIAKLLEAIAGAETVSGPKPPSAA